MRTKTVEYRAGNDLVYRIVVREANALVGVRRTILKTHGADYLSTISQNGAGAGEAEGEGQSEGESRPRYGALDIFALTVLATRFYPDLVSTVVESDGLDVEALTPETFIDLSDGLVDAWAEAVYALNEHWLPEKEPETPEEEADQKKRRSRNG